MRISIVTISFNQSRFIEHAISSVINQSYQNTEYIVVDPGSTDGSRDIITRYKSEISKIIFKPDSGPADGLNAGFSEATGEIFGFLNSDDVLEPGALDEVSEFFKNNKHVDVVSGNSYIIDIDGNIKRKFLSDPYIKELAIYNACNLSQASTFFRSRAFKNTKGFNIKNKLTWDGELFLDMAFKGVKFARVNRIWSRFRVYETSISGSGISKNRYKQNFEDIFIRIKGRKPSCLDSILFYFFKIFRKILNPIDSIERIKHGPIS